jgi:regulator of CtrA degradation
MTHIAPTAFFGKTFDEAMTLLVAARDYVAAGVAERPQDRSIEDHLRMARETMRVTARLTQIMAWLLAQKAVHAGELTPRQAASDAHRLAGQAICLDDDERHGAGLPEGLRELLKRSHALYVRVARLDELVRRAAE